MDLVLYVMINTDLKMGKGKIAGQVGHAVEDVVNYMSSHHLRIYSLYKLTGRRKIILKSNTEQMKALLAKYNLSQKEDIWCIPVYDAGMTQIPPMSLTAIGFGIISKEKAPIEIKEAKLL